MELQDNEISIITRGESELKTVHMKTSVGLAGAILPPSALHLSFVACLMPKGPYSILKVRERNSVGGGCWKCVPDSYGAGEK